MKNYAILINLNRCTGCWTCSLACKVAHNIEKKEDMRQFVRTIGSTDSEVDEPMGVFPNLSMSWMPIHTKKCTLCGDRIAEGELPYCVYNCSMQAMYFGDLEDPESTASKKMVELKEKGYEIFQLPAWEGSNTHIWYAKKFDK